MFIIVRLCT